MTELVYVAGPYSHPDPVLNTHNAIKAGLTLFKAGYGVIVPHLSLLVHMVEPHPEAFWYEWDNRQLPFCTKLLCLPGESSGAEKEVVLAVGLDIPVFYGTADEFIATYGVCLG